MGKPKFGSQNYLQTFSFEEMDRTRNNTRNEGWLNKTKSYCSIAVAVAPPNPSVNSVSCVGRICVDVVPARCHASAVPRRAPAGLRSSPVIWHRELQPHRPRPGTMTGIAVTWHTPHRLLVATATMSDHSTSSDPQKCCRVIIFVKVLGRFGNVFPSWSFGK